MDSAQREWLRWRAREGLWVGFWFCVVYAGSDWLTGRVAQKTDLPSMATQSDLLIPFWPAASWIYLSATPVMLLSLFVLSERSDVRALSVAVALEIAIAGLIYAFMPVEPTPRIDGDISSVFAFADRLNLTYNSFPSLHVALCTTGAVAMMAQGKTLRNAMLLLWALAVSGSTLVTHQHTIADVAGGVVLAGLGLIAFCVLRTVLPRSPKAA